jgi:hypothetical protein
MLNDDRIYSPRPPLPVVSYSQLFSQYGFQQPKGTHHVGLNEILGAAKGPVNGFFVVQSLS